MSIFTPCSDIETRQIMWVARKTETAPQTRFAGMINPAEGSWWAAVHADRYEEEAVGKLPTLD